MKFYFAGAFPQRDKFLEIVKRIEALGFESTSRWLLLEHSITDDNDAARLGAEYSKHDYDDVKAADVLILHTNDPADPYTSGGRHVEFGLAMAWEKPIIVLDPYQNSRAPGGKRRENIFHWSNSYVSWGGTLVPAVKIVTSENDLLRYLSNLDIIQANEHTWEEVDYTPPSIYDIARFHKYG